MTAVKILSKYGIHKTPIRKNVLHILIHSGQSLTCGEILQLMKNNVSRVSILRTLKFFHSFGLVHHAMSTTRKLSYFFAELPESASIYFKCIFCRKSFIFPVKEKIDLQLPGMLVADKIACIITGTCNRCSSSVTRVISKH